MRVSVRMHVRVRVRMSARVRVKVRGCEWIGICGRRKKKRRKRKRKKKERGRGRRGRETRRRERRRRGREGGRVKEKEREYLLLGTHIRSDVQQDSLWMKSAFIPSSFSIFLSNLISPILSPSPSPSYSLSLSLSLSPPFHTRSQPVIIIHFPFELMEQRTEDEGAVHTPTHHHHLRT